MLAVSTWHAPSNDPLSLAQVTCNHTVHASPVTSKHATTSSLHDGDNHGLVLIILLNSVLAFFFFFFKGRLLYS